jgi:hypothetical protein
MLKNSNTGLNAPLVAVFFKTPILSCLDWCCVREYPYLCQIPQSLPVLMPIYFLRVVILFFDRASAWLLEKNQIE